VCWLLENSLWEQWTKIEIPRRFAPDARQCQICVDLRNEFASGKRFGQIVIVCGAFSLIGKRRPRCSLAVQPYMGARSEGGWTSLTETELQAIIP
jgi:hypothetical protein